MVDRSGSVVDVLGRMTHRGAAHLRPLPSGQERCPASGNEEPERLFHESSVATKSRVNVPFDLQGVIGTIKDQGISSEGGDHSLVGALIVIGVGTASDNQGPPVLRDYAIAHVAHTEQWSEPYGLDSTYRLGNIQFDVRQCDRAEGLRNECDPIWPCFLHEPGDLRSDPGKQLLPLSVLAEAFVRLRVQDDSNFGSQLLEQQTRVVEHRSVRSVAAAAQENPQVVSHTRQG